MPVFINKQIENICTHTHTLQQTLSYQRQKRKYTRTEQHNTFTTEYRNAILFTVITTNGTFSTIQIHVNFTQWGEMKRK